MRESLCRMLDEFGAEIEHADSRLDATMKKMAKVLHLSDGKNSAYYISNSTVSTILFRSKTMDGNRCTIQRLVSGSIYAGPDVAIRIIY